MKRFIVEQLAEMRLDVERKFVVEVPDEFTEEQVEELLEDAGDSLKDCDGMEWIDGSDQRWSGYVVEVSSTDVNDPDIVMGGEQMAASLPVVRLEKHVECQRC